LSVYVDTDSTGQVDEERLSMALQQVMDLSPRGIREHLGLNKPIYARTTAYGHFGRRPDADGGFSWEKLDLVESLKSALHRSHVPLARHGGRAISTAGASAGGGGRASSGGWMNCSPASRSTRRRRP